MKDEDDGFKPIKCKYNNQTYMCMYYNEKMNFALITSDLKNHFFKFKVPFSDIQLEDDSK